MKQPIEYPHSSTVITVERIHISIQVAASLCPPKYHSHIRRTMHRGLVRPVKDDMGMPFGFSCAMMRMIMKVRVRNMEVVMFTLPLLCARGPSENWKDDSSDS